VTITPSTQYVLVNLLFQTKSDKNCREGLMITIHHGRSQFFERKIIKKWKIKN